MKSVLLIIEREFLSRVKKRSFILMTLLTPLLFAGSIFVYAFILSMKDTDVQSVKVVDSTGLIADKLANTEYFVFEKIATVPVDSLKSKYSGSGENYTILYVDGQQGELPKNFTLYSDRQVNNDLERYIGSSINNTIEDYKLRKYNIENLDEIMKEVKTNIDLRTIRWQKDGTDTETNSFVLMGISYVMAFIIYMFILMFGMMVMRGVIEEKSNRIIEVIVSSVRPFELMTGKIVGIALVALLQFFSWVILSGLFGFIALSLIPGAAAPQQAELAQIQPELQSQAWQVVMTTIGNINIPMILFTFLIFFLGGYLLYASMFASIGSAVEAEADVQQMMLPITIPLVLGLLIMVHTFQYPNSGLSFWASMIPFTSPMVMMARVPFGVSWWQIGLSAALLFGTFILFAYFAGKIYRVGILMYGKKHDLKEMWKWARYK